MTARRALAPLLALLLLLAACAAGQVIKIGTTQSLCGDGVEGSQSYRTALRFWEAYTNAHGGIDVNGTAHTVQLIMYAPPPPTLVREEFVLMSARLTLHRYNDAFDTNLISTYGHITEHSPDRKVIARHSSACRHPVRAVDFGRSSRCAHLALHYCRPCLHTGQEIRRTSPQITPSSCIIHPDLHRCLSLTSATSRASILSPADLTGSQCRYYATKGAPNGTFGGWLFSAVPNTLSYISQCFDTMCVAARPLCTVVIAR